MKSPHQQCIRFETSISGTTFNSWISMYTERWVDMGWNPPGADSSLDPCWYCRTILPRAGLSTVGKRLNMGRMISSFTIWPINETLSGYTYLYLNFEANNLYVNNNLTIISYFITIILRYWYTYLNVWGVDFANIDNGACVMRPKISSYIALYMMRTIGREGICRDIPLSADGLLVLDCWLTVFSVISFFSLRIAANYVDA